MNLLRLFLRLAFAALAFGHPPQQDKPTRLADSPNGLAERLYREVVARHPVGIPGDADMDVFAPYLTNKLLEAIHLFLACNADWLQRNPEPNLKPPFGVFETGLFSGGDERTEPQTFQVEGTRPQKGGTFLVYVSLAVGTPYAPPLAWRVALVVVREHGRLVIDDVIYLKDKDLDAESRLTKALSNECDGPRWIGGRDQGPSLKHQK